MITLIKSIIIGICAILPGVSGSVIAVSLGIYNKFIENITDYRKARENKLYLFIVILGVLIGTFMTSNILVYIFKYQTILYYILIGVILSEIPFLIKKIHNNSQKVMILPFIFAFTLSLALDLLNSNEFIINSIFKYFLGGILFSFGKVFPGVSSSFFLLSLGIYKDIIVLLTKPSLLITNFSLYLPFIIGTIIGTMIFLRLLAYLLNNKYNLIYSIIIGFMLSSVVILFPKFSLNFSNIIGVALMNVFFLIFVYIKKKNNT